MNSQQLKGLEERQLDELIEGSQVRIANEKRDLDKYMAEKRARVATRARVIGSQENANT